MFGHAQKNCAKRTKSLTFNSVSLQPFLYSKSFYKGLCGEQMNRLCNEKGFSRRAYRMGLVSPMVAVWMMDWPVAVQSMKLNAWAVSCWQERPENFVRVAAIVCMLEGRRMYLEDYGSSTLTAIGTLSSKKPLPSRRVSISSPKGKRCQPIRPAFDDGTYRSHLLPWGTETLSGAYIYQWGM